MKSFLTMRSKMSARNAVRSNTRMRELMMDSQWISNVYGRKPPSEYLHRTNKKLFDEAVRLA